jgi:hypothetical protein
MKSYRSPSFLLLCSVLLLPGFPAPARPSSLTDKPLPKVLSQPLYKSSLPVWVEASIAVLANGDLNQELLGADAVRILKNQLREPRGRECTQFTEVYDSVPNPPVRGDIPSATRTAALVVEGKVTGRSFGFRGDIPGQLLRVRVEEVFKGGVPKGEDRFVFLPVATFQAGPYRICKTDQRYPTPPEPGERVLLFIPFVKEAQAPFLELFDDGGLVTVRADEKAALPGRFLRNAQSQKRTPPTTEAEVVAQIRDTLRADEKP